MSAEIKLNFVVKCLADYFTSAMAAMRIAAKRAKVGVTDEAIQSLAYDALKKGGGAAGTLSFQNVLRFVDMGVGRGHPLGGIKAVTVELQSRNQKGLAYVKDNTRKPKKIYSKIVYGKLSYLQNKLLHGYTEETIAMLKQQMQQNATN